MKLITSDKMRRIDAKTDKEYNIKLIELMENAGRRVYEVIRSKFGSPDNKHFYIFCGKGNNGGDGLVTARLLHECTPKVVIFLIGKEEEVKGEAKENLKKVKSRNIKLHEVTQIEDLQVMKDYFEPDLIIDALLGTGTKGELSSLYQEVIRVINSLNKPVVSVDIPTGIDADTGRILGECIRAVYTVTMGAPKPGLYIYPGAKYTGEVIVADIGHPKELLEDESININLVTKELVQTLLPKKREPDTNKGDYGRTLILAGSVGLTGAAYMTALACCKIGAGLVTLGLPASLNDLMEVKLTEVMTYPLPETRERTLSLIGLGEIRRLLPQFDVLAIGPGLSRNDETAKLIRQIIREVKIPTVIDADAINALSFDPDPLVINESEKMVLIPHPGELARLLHREIKDIMEDKLDIITGVAKRFNKVFVLKVANSIIASPTKIFINSTGNPALAKGGTGDVLCGMIAGLLSQGLTPLDAAICGVYLHGYIADKLVEKKDEMCILATDLIEEMPYVMKEIRSEM